MSGNDRPLGASGGAPFVPRPAPGARAAAARQPAGDAPVLLVDDQPARLLSYEAILADLGHPLVKAGSGTEALARLMERDFAAILLDVNMPGMDGFETAAMIHEHPRFERTPIIFVTGVHVTDLDELRGYRSGAFDYVYVPVVPEILRSKVSMLVELYLQRHELKRVNAQLAAANAELALANEALHRESTLELQRLNATLERANREMAEANTSLRGEVAERERIQRALEMADRRKDEFLAMLAHELRNPLSAIQNGVRLFEAKESALDADLRWTRGVLARQVGHLTRLVDDLLDMSRISTGKVKLQPVRSDIARIVASAIETSRPHIEAKRHALRVDLPPSPLQIDADAVRLTQVIDNLLTNAAKYTDAGGSIHVRVERVDGRALVRVADTGIGIAADMLGHVFELFAQADPSLDRSQGGLGIGLALARALVEMHGGTIEARSEGPGRGSEFVVALPLVVERPDDRALLR